MLGGVSFPRSMVAYRPCQGKIGKTSKHEKEDGITWLVAAHLCLSCALAGRSSACQLITVEEGCFALGDWGVGHDQGAGVGADDL